MRKIKSKVSLLVSFCAPPFSFLAPAVSSRPRYLIVVTNNRNEFARIPGLDIIEF